MTCDRQIFGEVTKDGSVQPVREVGDGFYYNGVCCTNIPKSRLISPLRGFEDILDSSLEQTSAERLSEHNTPDSVKIRRRKFMGIF